MAVGSDAYGSALDVYAYAKLTDGVMGLEALNEPWVIASGVTALAVIL